MQVASAQRTYKVLSQAQVEAYRRNGYHFPLRVLSTAEARETLGKLEAFERSQGKPLGGSMRTKPHLLFTWADALVHHPKILDAVEDILGPNFLAWSSSFFNKEAHDPGFVSWHQDSTYWGLSQPDIVTAWVAFTPSNVANGCMRAIPGSHLKDQLPHKDTFAQNNLLTRGQEVLVEVNESEAVDFILEQGEFSLHHVRIVHGSEPNHSDGRRIGLAIRYLPTYVKQTAGPRDTAMLVRGVDAYHHFEYEPRPKADMHPEAVAYHRRVVEETNQILYRGTGKAPKLS
ncbi:MAG: phytanoyl-CoA dioxygenase family protein [Burkholderiales bacterium]